MGVLEYIFVQEADACVVDIVMEQDIAGAGGSPHYWSSYSTGSLLVRASTGHHCHENWGMVAGTIEAR